MNILLHLAHMSLIQIIMLGAFFSGLYWFTGYNKGESLKNEINNIRTQISNVDLKIQKTKKDIENMNQFKKSVEESGSESIKFILQYVPNLLTTATMFSYLIKEAKEAGIDIVDKRDDGISDFEQFYETLKLHIKISGSFLQIVYFLSRLTEQKIILTSDNITMNRVSGGRSVVANVDIYGYRYVDKKEEDEEKEKGKK